MSSNTPSGRRRRGRMAFFPGGDMEQSNPYRGDYYRRDFNDGWQEAERQHADDKLAEENKPDSVAQIILDMLDAYERNGILVASDYRHRLETLS